MYPEILENTDVRYNTHVGLVMEVYHRTRVLATLNLITDGIRSNVDPGAIWRSVLTSLRENTRRSINFSAPNLLT